MLKKLSNVLIYSLLAVLFFTALLVSGLTVSSKRRAAAEKERRRTETVLKIGGRDVTRDEFILVCRGVISSELEKLRPSSMVEDALGNAVKERAKNYEIEYTGLLTAAQKNGTTLSKQERESVKTEVESAGDDDFYYENYGISREKYIEIAENWALCEKFLENKENELDFSKENLEKYFDKNIEKLASVDVNLIFFDTSLQGVGGLNKIEAADIFERVSADPSLFEEFFEEYNDAGFPGGETLRCRLESEAGARFPEVLRAAIEADDGKVLSVETENGIAVFEIVEKELFDYERDSEKICALMTEEARKLAVENACEGIEVITTDAYKTLNINYLLNERSNEN